MARAKALLWHPSKRTGARYTAYNLIHGYYACVSYIDAQIGLMLNALESLGLKDNTIVILLGDHGFFLVEFVDIYPTPCELAGLDLPYHLQGKSFVPLLNSPGESYARMPYDRLADPEENVNISEHSENERIIKELHYKLVIHLEKRDRIIQ